MHEDFPPVNDLIISHNRYWLNNMPIQRTEMPRAQLRIKSQIGPNVQMIGELPSPGLAYRKKKIGRTQIEEREPAFPDTYYEHTRDSRDVMIYNFVDVPPEFFSQMYKEF